MGNKTQNHKTEVLVMFQLRIDIQKSDLLWRSFYSGKFPEIEVARASASIQRNKLFRLLADGKIKDYRVDILPAN